LLYIIFLFSVCSLFWLLTKSGQKDSSKDAYLSQGDYLHKDQIEKCFYVFFGLVYCFIVCLPQLCTIYFILLWHDTACLC